MARIAAGLICVGILMASPPNDDAFDVVTWFAFLLFGLHLAITGAHRFLRSER